MGRRLRSLVFLCFVFSLMGPVAGAAQDSSGVLGHLTGSDAYDLSAMTLTPLDLEDEGLEGYGIRSGWTDTLDDEFTQLIASGSISASDVEELLEEAEFVSSRAVQLDLPSEDDPSFAARRVNVWVDQYGEPDALPDVIDAYLNFGNALDVEGTGEIGDYSRMIAFIDETPDTGVAANHLMLAFAFEDMIGQIEVVEFETQLPDVNPTIEEIEALAERLLERIETVREDGAPGLESRVLRLETDGIQATYGNDYYILLDEETLPRYGEADDAVDTRAEEYAEDGVTSQYVVDQTVYGADDQRLQWAVRLRQFDRARDAGDWLSILPERAEDGWLTGGAEIDDLEIEEIDDLGDGAVLFTGTVVGDDLGIAMLFVQSGELVTMVGVYSAIGVFDADALIELAGEQLDCVDDGGCDMAYPIPDEMLEFVEGRG